MYCHAAWVFTQEHAPLCDCIYNEYMGAFLLQPLSVLLQAKQINGDPVQSNFKDHEEFLMRIFRLLKRYRLEKFVSSMDVTILHKSDNENNAHILCRVEEAYFKF